MRALTAAPTSQQRRRNLARDHDVRIEFLRRNRSGHFVLVLHGQVTRIDRDRKVRSAAGDICLIQWRVRHQIERCAGQYRQVVLPGVEANQ